MRIQPIENFGFVVEIYDGQWEAREICGAVGAALRMKLGVVVVELFGSGVK